MNRTRMMALAGVALVLSLAVTMFTYRVLRNRLQPPPEMGQIVIANEKMSLGTRLTIADVRLVPWPRAVPIEGSFQDPNAVVGRGVISPLLPNEPILESKLAPREAGAGLTSAIPEGMRAVAVKVNDVIGVAGFVVPGTRVDVILTGTPGWGKDIEMSRVILENVQVLAAGQNVDHDADGKPLNVQVITLLVTPDDSQKLALASTEGKIQLALRNPLDLDLTNPVAVERPKLFYSALNQAPAPEAPQPQPKPRPVVRKPEPVPVPVVAPPAPQPPAKPTVLEIQLIQGKETKTVTFEEKP
jgi:pilus assembly protein CpaB